MVTAPRPRQIPSVFFKKLDEVPYFHRENNTAITGPEEDAYRPSRLGAAISMFVLTPC
jgi:hypothetical protein